MSSTLVLKEGTGDRDKLTWKRAHGQSTTPSEYSDPAVNATYTFCLFAGSDNAVVAAAELPPDAVHWEPTSKGFTYRDPAAAVDGIARVKLTADEMDSAGITLAGRGAGLDIAMPPFDLPITTQLVNSQSNVCWAASYDAADVRRNGAGKLSVKANAH